MTNQRPDPETEIEAALSALRDSVEVPPVDPAREQVLLEAFDAHRAQPRSRGRRWVWMTAAAAVIALAAGLTWRGRIAAPQVEQAIVEDGPETIDFVSWPGAEAWPMFESGSLVRVDVPASALPALGLWPPASAGEVVQADIIVGQDGLPRAIQLVQ
jgi:hypothetical protein